MVEKNKDEKAILNKLGITELNEMQVEAYGARQVLPFLQSRK